MAQPAAPAATKLRIKLKGVPKQQQQAAATPTGPVPDLKAAIQAQDLRAAVEAFCWQGVHALPERELLHPWNDDAVLQAQQEVIPGYPLCGQQQPQQPHSSKPRERKRRAAASAEFSLLEMGPQYVVWGRDKRPRSQGPPRAAKSAAQLSNSLQRMMSDKSTGSIPSAPAPQAAAAAAVAQQQAQDHHQQQQQQLGMQRPPSPQLPGAFEPVTAAQQGPVQQLPEVLPGRLAAATGQQMAPAGLNGPVPVAAVPQAAAPQQQQQWSGAAFAGSVQQQQAASQQGAAAAAAPSGQQQQQQAATAGAQPHAAPAPQQVAQQVDEAPMQDPMQVDEAPMQEAAAAAAAASNHGSQGLPSKQPAEQLVPAAAQAPAKQAVRQPSQQQGHDPSASEASDSIATRLRRKKPAEQSEAASKPPQQPPPKQAKGKQKQKLESAHEQGPPAKKARGAAAAQPSDAAAGKATGSQGGSKTAAAPGMQAATKAPAAKAPAVKGSAVAQGKPAAGKPGKQAAAAAASAKHAAAKAPAAATGQAAATGSAGAGGRAPLAKPAAAGKAGAGSKPAAGAAAAPASGSKPAAAAAAAVKAAAARKAPAEVAAANAAAKPDSPPSETSHQQPVAASMPQHMQQLQPQLQPLVPSLPQEQTAVSRDRSQCSLQQQPGESHAAAVASAHAAGRIPAAGAGAAAMGGAAAAAAGAAPAAAGGVANVPKQHLLELEASAMGPAALALGSMQVPTVTFRPLLPEKPFATQEEAIAYLDSMMAEARKKKHSGDQRSQQQGGWDVFSLTYYAHSALEFLRYWDACPRAVKQLVDARKPADQLKRRVQQVRTLGLLKQVGMLCTNALQNASNCRGQDVQKQALRMLLERLTAICQLRHLHSQREALAAQANLLRGTSSSSSIKPNQQQQQQQRVGASRPPARAGASTAAAAAAHTAPAAGSGGTSSGKQAMNNSSPDDSNTSNQDRVQLHAALNAEQLSPGLMQGGSPSGHAAGGHGIAAAAGGAAVASHERQLMIAESTCAEHLGDMLKVTDGMHQTVMRMQQFLESPEVLADEDARAAALHISTLGLDAGMFSIPRVVAHAEAALVRIVRSGRRGMVRMAG